MSFAGLDVGGTYLKATVFDSSGLPGPVLRQRTPGFLDVAGTAREMDPDALLTAVFAVLRAAISGRALSGILISGQMAGSAIVNSSGKARLPIITWQDTRARDVRAVVQRLGSAGPEVIRRTGSEIRVGLPIMTLTEVRMQANDRFTSLIGFVAGGLCGTFATHLHTTDAASSGLYDLVDGRWSSEALSLVGLNSARMPAVSADIVSTGFSTEFGCPVFSPIGDQQAALLGAELQTGEISMNIATGGQVSLISKSTDSPAQLRPYFFDHYLHTVTHLPSGRFLTATLAETVGRDPSQADWDWALAAVNARDAAAAKMESASVTVADSFIEAARRLDPNGSLSICFSGGVAQKFTTLSNRIATAVRVPSRFFGGNDAALASLGILSRSMN